MATLHTMIKGTAALCLGATLSVAQAGVFDINTDVNGNRTTSSFESVEDAFEALSTSRFSSLNPAYTGVQAATVNIDYRGLGMVTTYPTAGSPLLVLDIPSLGIRETFNGGNRDASQDLLKEYFKSNSADILGRISKALAKNSPVDPIAGNPNSLMSQMVFQDFNNAFTSFATNIKSGDASSNLIGVGIGVGQYRQGGVTSRAVTLPLSYTFRNDLDPRRQVTLSAPITSTDADGSKGYSFGLGGAYRFPMNDNWALSGAVNYALTGSKDLGALAAMTSVSLTSSYLIPMEKFDLAIGNMIGYYKAMKAKSGDYGYEPDIANTVLRNGVMLSQPITVSGRGMSVEYSLVHTHFSGTELYNKQYVELGVSLGTNKRATSARSYFRSGINYLHSSNSKGFNITLGYWF
jgi:hypothetical protein